MKGSGRRSGGLRPRGERFLLNNLSGLSRIRLFRVMESTKMTQVLTLSGIFGRCVGKAL